MTAGRSHIGAGLGSGTIGSIDGVAWTENLRDVEIAPSLYAGDFWRLGEQIEGLLAAGCRIFHFDVGDGHFIPPVTIGPVVLRSIAERIHAAGGVLDCHLMVTDPAHHFAEIAASGGDSVTFHVEVADDARRVAAAARDHGLAVGVAFNPQTSPERAAEAVAAAQADLALCMSINPGYSGQSFMPEAVERVARLAMLVEVPIEVDGGVDATNARTLAEAGARILVAGTAVMAKPEPAAAYRGFVELVR